MTLSRNSSSPLETPNQELLRQIYEAASQEAWTEAQKIKAANKRLEEIQKYANDPVGFCTEVLKEHYTDEIMDVMISVRDNPVTIARSANGVGKTFGASRIAVWFFSVFEDAKVYVTAAPPLENLKKILWGEIASVIENRPDLFSGFKNRSLDVIRDPKSFITGVAIPTSGTTAEREAKFNGRHAPHLLFIVDEGDAVPDEIYRAIESCMSGGIMARLLVMFNPRAQSGPVYSKERDGQAHVVHISALNHPNVVSGNDIIPGAVTRQTVLRRINQWTRPLADNEAVDSECFDPPDYLLGQKCFGLDGIEYPPLPPGARKVKEPAFFYMVVGNYPPQGENQLISQAWVDAARARWDAYVAMNGEREPVGTEAVLSLDVAEMGTDYNVACIRYGGWVSKLRLWHGIDVDETTLHILELYYEVNASIAHIDGTGVGSSVAPAMARKGRKANVRAISVKVAEKPSMAIKTEIGEFRSLRDQLWWAVREWLRADPGAMLPPDAFLVEELRTPTYRVNPLTGKLEVMGKDQMRDLLKRSPDRADALCLTFNPVYRPKWVKLDAYSKSRERSFV